MTRFFRTWLVMASVALLSNWCWAQAPQYQGPQPQFEGFAPGWGVQYNGGHAAPSNGPWPAQDELIPDHAPILDFDLFEQLAIKDIFAGTSIQTEYVYANFENPGNAILGAPISVVPNPREPFIIQAGDLLESRAIVPNTSSMKLSAQSGIRTTITIDSFKDFAIVGSWLGMLDMKSSFRITPGGVDPVLNPGAFDSFLFPDNARFIATSVSGDRLILYDRAFEAALQANFWTADVNLLFHNNAPQYGFRLKPLVGFRFNYFDESLTQHGEFDNSSGVSSTSGVLATPTRNTIMTATHNQMVMGQVGFQAELADKWFTLGFAPKIAMGANMVDTHVYTADLRDSDIDETVNDGETFASSSFTRVGANFDLNTYARVRVNEWLNLTASAYYWFMPVTSRANTSLSYEDNGIAVPPAFRPSGVTTGMGVTGFTFGVEARF